MSDIVHVDRAVARRILAGDEAAFQELFDRFFPRLYRFALARLDGDQETARDVVQQTFCNAIERLDGYRGEAALYTWFCQICRNVLSDYWRDRQRRDQRTVPLEDRAEVRAVLEALTAPAADTPEVGLWQSEVRRVVEAAVDGLPGHYGDLLEWKYIDGMSVKDIAARLGQSPKATESMLGRARAAFRDSVTELAGTPEVMVPPTTQ